MTQDYDIAVIGGGIQGVGVAQAAVAAGYSVILFEQSGLGAGTSSRSSKLIHGGLRYLESAQFGLVRKALQERALLLRLAPELVRLVPFYIPVYRSTSRRPWQISAGLSLYALLANLSRDALYKKIGSAVWSKLDGLVTEDLQAVYRYQDAQTDDAALTRAVMQSALELGAELKCPARIMQVNFEKPGFDLHYEQQAQQCECRCKVVVNAAGPWVNQIMANVSPVLTGLEVDLVQGSHLILNVPAPDGIYYVEAPQDRRAVFVMPWQGQTMIGTTESAYTGDPAAVHVLPEEQSYLLEVYRHYFPAQEVQVIDSFAGLRVLPKTGHHFFHRPRDTIIHQDKKIPGVVTLYGGKLTGYRATAQQVMHAIRPLLPTRKAIADTGKLKLSPVDSPLC